jgi:transposase-like protein
MEQTAKPTRQNRTITIDFHDETTDVALLGNTQAFVEFVLAFILSIGFQLKHQATYSGRGRLTRHSHYARVRLGGLTVWRLPCTMCRAVFTVLPHWVLRYRQMRPEVARHALLATHGGLSLEWCAVIGHISSMALYRMIAPSGSCTASVRLMNGVSSKLVCVRKMSLSADFKWGDPRFTQRRMLVC